MNAQQLKALTSCMSDHAINPQELYGYLEDVRTGDFHFTNGAHFPVLIPGLVADGVFITPEYYVTKEERDGSTSYARACRFCENRNTVLPSPQARDVMERNYVSINESLAAIGFPELVFGVYWAEGDDTCWGMNKHVRGCIQVTPKPAENLQSFVETFVARSVFERLLKGLGCSACAFDIYCRNLNNYPQAGQYLLKNGSCSPVTVFNQETGIFVNPNLYLSLELPPAPLTAEQTDVFCKAYGVRIPEYFELRQIAKASEALNRALDAVGMADFRLPDDVIAGCWCYESMSRALEDDDVSPRRVLLVGKKDNVPDFYILLQDIQANVRYL